MFPFSFGRTIEIPITDNTVESVSEMIASTLVRLIKAEKPSSFTSNQNHITFTGGVFRFAGSWNLLVSINYGAIDIVQVNNKLLVSYKLWFVELFIFASLITAMFAYLILSSDFSVQNLGLVAGTWLWFFGGNFIITVIRFHSLVRSASRK